MTGRGAVELPDGPPFMTVREAAELVGLKPYVLYREHERGNLELVRLAGRERSYRVRRDDLARFVEESIVPA